MPDIIIRKQSNAVNLVGQRFGRWVVISQAPGITDKHGWELRSWVCLCDCGTRRVVNHHSLIRGLSKSCGCRRMGRRTIDRTGQRYGSLLVLRKARHGGARNARHTFWECRCDCGRTTIVSSGHLTQGDTRSCGCMGSRKTIGDRRRTHGMSGTPIYKVWRAMIVRCTDPKACSYERYGGRGILVCERWLHSFDAFFADMGPTYRSGLTLERKNNNGNYEPGNCRWATIYEQANNKRGNRLITFRGTTLTAAQWGRKLGISGLRVAARLRSGWSIARALTSPIRKCGLTFDGRTQTVIQWAQELSIRPSILYNRLYLGWSVERALTEPIHKERCRKQNRENGGH